MSTMFRTSRPGLRRLVLSLEPLDERCLLSGGFGYFTTNLASDIPGLAPHTEPNLPNAWGILENNQGQFLIAANGPGDALLLNSHGVTLAQPIVLPPPLGSAPGTTTTPNGVVANTARGFFISMNGRFAPATDIFSTEDGTIVAWNPNLSPTQGVLAADESATGAVYKGLAMGSNRFGTFLYATDFHNGKIDVFDRNFHLVQLGGNFTDPFGLPAGFAPFGIKSIHGNLYVTYALQDSDRHDDVAGLGNGIIDVFDTSGHFLRRFAAGGLMNSPWGMAVAPANFGVFSNALLVGNFGDSHINAFNLRTGAFLGQLTDVNGNPLVLNGGQSSSKGLWGITFGNGRGGAPTNTLFFASGINDENDGLFGAINAIPGRHRR